MSGRIPYLDGLRVFAIVAVVTVHVTCMFYTNAGISDWYAACTYGSLVRWCVPVFCMISGALFLTKKELSLGSLYSRYIKRIVIAFLFWSTIYAILYSSHPFSAKEFIGNIAHGHYHLWFLFMICGLYIALPILRLIFANRIVLRYFLMVSFIVAFVIPFFFDISHSFGIIENFIERLEHGYNRMGLHLFFGFTSYFLWGGVLKTYELCPQRRRVLYATGVFCGFLIVILTSLLHQRNGTGVNEVFYNYTGLLVFVLSISIFIYGRYSRWFEQLSKTVLTKISDLVFGVYLIHIIILDNMMRIMPDIRLSVWLEIPLITLCVFSISLVVVWLLKKYVPYTNYVL